MEISDFEFVSDFGLRISDFRICFALRIGEGEWTPAGLLGHRRGKPTGVGVIMFLSMEIAMRIIRGTFAGVLAIALGLGGFGCGDQTTSTSAPKNNPGQGQESGPNKQGADLRNEIERKKKAMMDKNAADQAEKEKNKDNGKGKDKDIEKDKAKESKDKEKDKQ